MIAKFTVDVCFHVICQSRIGVHSEQARLLQYGTGKSTTVHYCTTTACSKRCGTTHQRPPPTRSCDVNSMRPTLAADQASCHI